MGVLLSLTSWWLILMFWIFSSFPPTISGPFLTSNHSKTTTNEESSKSVRLGDGAIFGLQQSTSLLLNGSVWLGIQSWKQIWMAKFNGSIRSFLLDYGVIWGFAVSMFFLLKVWRFFAEAQAAMLLRHRRQEPCTTRSTAKRRTERNSRVAKKQCCRRSRWRSWDTWQFDSTAPREIDRNLGKL